MQLISLTAKFYSWLIPKPMVLDTKYTLVIINVDNKKIKVLKYICKNFINCKHFYKNDLIAPQCS